MGNGDIMIKLTKIQIIFCFIVDIGACILSIIWKDWIALSFCILALIGLIINIKKTYTIK